VFWPVARTPFFLIGHLVQCLRRRRVVYKAREKYKIDSEDEVYRFFLGKDYKGIGARE
jgi:hypothetical protein